MNDREISPPTEEPAPSPITEPSSGKRTYQAPAVVSAEDLEAAAANCGGTSGVGKFPQNPACNPNTPGS
jgi:hypothetical protein